MSTKKKSGAEPARKSLAQENSQQEPPSGANISAADSIEGDIFERIDPRLIDRSPFQHRTVFDADEMDELRTDIGKQGIHTPLIVRRQPDDPDRFQLATGERRLRCATELALPLVPVFIRTLNDRQVQELQWSENFRRTNPNHLDEAKGLHHMLAHHKSVDGLARYLNKPRAYILTRLQLLDLIEPIQEMVHAGVFNLKDSLELACLEEKAQQSFFDERCKGWKEKKGFRLGNLEYLLNLYRCDLDRAIFNPKDKDLVPEAGACTRCAYNSATYQSLFPETEKRAVCNRMECYANKTRAQLRLKVRELIGRHQPNAIVVSGKLDSNWQTLLDEIPESAAWPRYDWTDASTTWPPEAPDRTEFEDEDMTGGFDEAEYATAIEEYNKDRVDFEESINAGRVLRTLCISAREVEFNYVDIEPTRKPTSGKTICLATAEAVKTAIKAGTATPTLLGGEITRLQDRETRSQELDQEKIQREIHTQVKQRFSDPAAPATLTPGDHLGIRLLIYQSLDYAGRTVLHEQIPYEEISEDQVEYPLTDWLEGLTEAQVALMTRLAIHGKSEALVPDSPAAITLVRIATDIGLDVPAIRAAQEKIATDRQTRMAERIAGLEAKMVNLKEKEVERVS